ncbi:hypothetical protein BJ508DRAFT_314699 [Ascobolus immersus RN42]|uniref:CxC1-like cysteine cluster associated with KDZ transposases domain-containing protein n=1 Tax=Ascobolus immersus RN42 TaxID=1160509 RepID=A0A3N4HIL0_ASCIM|nr:hypothetical protein BJ508DRAFT_314699 [Ascobolus immersus RN42]
MAPSGSKKKRVRNRGESTVGIFVDKRTREVRRVDSKKLRFKEPTVENPSAERLASAQTVPLMGRFDSDSIAAGAENYPDYFNNGDNGFGEHDKTEQILFESAQPSRSGETTEFNRQTEQEMAAIIPFLAGIYATGIGRCHCGTPEFAPKRNRVKVYCIGLLESRRRRFRKCIRCNSYIGIIIAGGYFPTSINEPRTAISFEVLDFFQKLSSNGAFSKQGFAKSLHEFHRDSLRIKPKFMRQSYEEPFRKAIPFWLRTKRKRDDIVNERLNSFIMDNQDFIAAGDSLRSAKNIPKGIQIKFQTGSLTGLCPACFYRIDENDKTVTVISIDGNFQHFRLASVGKMSVGEYETLLFLDATATERKVADTTVPDSNPNCSHNFVATDKPQTMRHLDETGLISVVCRFVNMYAGERLGWITFTVDKFLCLLRDEVKEEDIVALYDVACQFGPHLRNNRPDLLKYIRVAVNKFHGYAHEYKCHETWGAVQTAGIGDSDGEGTERVWALLRTIIVSGRDSTKANRKLFIENLALAIAEKKRADCSTSIIRRYVNCVKRLRGHQARLKAAFSTPLTDKAKGGETVHITEELLRAEHTSQRNYFSSTGSLLSTKYLEIYKSLQSERDLKERIEAFNTEYTSKGSTFKVGDALHSREATAKGLTDAALFELHERNEALLRKHHQAREEWDIGKERDRLAARWAHPNKDIYDVVLAEKVAYEEMHGGDNIESKAELKRSYDTAHRKTDALLSVRGQTRAAWFSPDSILWAQYHDQDTLFKLEQTYQKLVQAAGARAMKHRQLHSQSNGNKVSKKIVDQLFKHTPVMQGLVKTFNELGSKLSPGLKPPTLQLDAFKGVDELDRAESARDSLFALHVLRSQVADLDCVPTYLWSRFAAVRHGITDQLKRDRSQEELELLKREWDRSVLYTRNVVVTLLAALEPGTPGVDLYSCSHLEKFRPSLTRMLWSEMDILHRTLKRIELAKKQLAKKAIARRRAPAHLVVPDDHELVVDISTLDPLDFEELYARCAKVTSGWRTTRKGVGVAMDHDFTREANATLLTDAGNDTHATIVFGDATLGSLIDLDGDTTVGEMEANATLATEAGNDTHASHMFGNATLGSIKFQSGENTVNQMDMGGTEFISPNNTLGRNEPSSSIIEYIPPGRPTQEILGDQRRAYPLEDNTSDFFANKCGGSEEPEDDTDSELECQEGDMEENDVNGESEEVAIEENEDQDEEFNMRVRTLLGTGGILEDDKLAVSFEAMDL